MTIYITNPWQHTRPYPMINLYVYNYFKKNCQISHISEKKYILQNNFKITLNTKYC